MSLPSQTILNAEVVLAYPALSDRHLLVCLVGYYAGLTGLTAQNAINGSAAAGYQELSDQALDECLLDVLSK